MKRKLDICRNCSCFATSKNCGDICSKSNDAFEMLFIHISNKVSAGMGIPRDFFASANESAKPFEEKDIPSDCAMMAEYLVSEWNNEQKI